MKYVPFTDEEINQTEELTELSLGYLSGADKDIRCQIMGNNKKNPKLVSPFCDLEISEIHNTVLVERLSLSSEKKAWTPKWRELVLELCLRYIIRRAKARRNKRPNIRWVKIYTSEPQMPELLVKKGFRLESFKGSLVGQYTAELELK